MGEGRAPGRRRAAGRCRGSARAGGVRWSVGAATRPARAPTRSFGPANLQVLSYVRGKLEAEAAGAPRTEKLREVLRFEMSTGARRGGAAAAAAIGASEAALGAAAEVYCRSLHLPKVCGGAGGGAEGAHGRGACSLALCSAGLARWAPSGGSLQSPGTPKGGAFWWRSHHNPRRPARACPACGRCVRPVRRRTSGPARRSSTLSRSRTNWRRPLRRAHGSPSGLRALTRRATSRHMKSRWGLTSTTRWRASTWCGPRGGPPAGQPGPPGSG